VSSSSVVRPFLSAFPHVVRDDRCDAHGEDPDHHRPARRTHPVSGYDSDGRCESELVGDLVPLLDGPGAHHTFEHERIAGDELLGRSPCGEDRHRTVTLGIGEHTDEPQLASGLELGQTSSMPRIVGGHARHDVVSGFVEQHMDAHPPMFVHPADAASQLPLRNVSDGGGVVDVGQWPHTDRPAKAAMR